jgi:hypothetical protein
MMLADSSGPLAVSAIDGISETGAGTTSLSLAGTMAGINAALALLTDTDGSTADAITINASDAFSQTAARHSIEVSVAGLPVLAAPATATINLGTTDQWRFRQRVQRRTPAPGRWN